MGVWWVIQIWAYPVVVARYFPLLVDRLFHPQGLFGPAYAFPLENFLLWFLLRLLKVRSLAALVAFHWGVLLVFITTAYFLFRRKLDPHLADRAFLLFLLSPFPFTAGVLHLPNNDVLVFLLMLLAWALPAALPRFLVGLLLGWAHYPTALAGWLAWTLSRRRCPEGSLMALLLGTLAGAVLLKVFLRALGLPPDARLQFFALWADQIFRWGVMALPFWLWSLLGPLWIVIFWMRPERRRGLFRALLLAVAASALAMDRTRIAGGVLFWPVLESVLTDPGVLEKLRGKRLVFLVIFWAVWPFTYVWENRLLLPWLGFRTLPLP